MFYYIAKIRQYGFFVSIKKAVSRIDIAFKSYQLRQNVRKKILISQWPQLQEKNHLSAWGLWWEQKKNIKTECFSIIISQTKPVTNYTSEDLLNNCFSILGAAKKCFIDIAWHTDFKCDNENGVFDPLLFYQDFAIQAGKCKTYQKDIKVPWELSRFQHIADLGLFFEKTQDIRFAQQFQKQIEDWIVKNPLMLGPNWVCPMDVAIRAVNWIWGFYYFKEAINDDRFWQTFVCSLHDHMQFLKNNWEKYESYTSNHYLADLVGYLYLCFFFIDLPEVKDEWHWCVREIKQEFEKQVFEEGTDFEGSTSYHRMVTEFFYHAFMLIHMQEKEAIPEKLKKMFTFVDACMINKTEWIQIGDNDSGKLVFGITDTLIDTYVTKREEIMHWPHFGISIIKKKDIHVSVRHHAFKNNQSSGHFHVDAAHVTFAAQGIPLLVDPGTYVYTASADWRNFFRSSHAHNAPRIDEFDPVVCDDSLFTLAIPESTSSTHRVFEHNEDVVIETAHTLYVLRVFLLKRIVKTNTLTNTVEIIDQWIPRQNKIVNNTSKWNFTLGPDIDVLKKNNMLLCTHKNQIIVSVQASIPLTITSGYFSPSYGVKQEVVCLQAVVPLKIDQQYYFKFIGK